MNNEQDQLNILAPRQMKPKLDYLHREVQRTAGRPISRRQALGLGGVALVAAACSSTTTTSAGSTSSSSGSSANPLTSKPLENAIAFGREVNFVRCFRLQHRLSDQTTDAQGFGDRSTR